MRVISTNKSIAIMAMLFVLCSVSVLGQSTRAEILDSLQEAGYTIIYSKNGIQQFDSNMSGDNMWSGCSAPQVLPSDSNKRLIEAFTYFENGCVKLTAQFDMSQLKEDFSTAESYYGSRCDSIWAEEINVQINSSNEVTINTSSDVIVEIYKARIIFPLMKFFAEGTGSDQSFEVDLENNTTYFFVFRDAADKIVNVKIIGRL